MTPTSPRTTALLFITSLVLAVAGVVLLSVPRDHGAPSPLASSATPGALPSPREPAAASSPSTTRPAVTVVPSVSRSGPVLPPHGEGVSGDRAIQQSLERAWPADLASADEKQLCALGTSLLRADATGIGRADWPVFFGERRQAVAPAFAVARFRIQAVIARRGGAVGRAVVHLVWAGADRGGTYTDGRVTDLHFTRTVTRKGAKWIPQPQH